MLMEKSMKKTEVLTLGEKQKHLQQNNISTFKTAQSRLQRECKNEHFSNSSWKRFPAFS